MKSNAFRYWVPVLAATAVGITLRALIAYNGSIWADEGTFLNVVAAPTTSEMIAFLKNHESHPPLFYLVMRAWSHVANGRDSILLLAPIALGGLIVPAMFLVGRELFSERVGMIAALIAAVAPQMTEHASQLRPYGLLALFTLASAASLIVVTTSPTRRALVCYCAATVAMLYTHNWGWLIGAGEIAAASIVIRHQRSGVRRETIRRIALSWVLILAPYSLWIPSFLFQSAHAGHGRLPLENVTDYLGYLFFSVSVIVESLIVGRHGDRETVAIAGLCVALIVFVLVRLRYQQQRGQSSSHSMGGVRAKMCVNIALFALLAALVLSPFNNLILPRSVATVMPMLILATAFWIAGLVERSPARSAAQLGTAILAFAFASAIFQTSALLTRPRSNTGAIADQVRTSVRRNDLLIVAPEWFAPSFDHYFPPSIEQIDYPYETRSSMIDFSNIWLTRVQSSAAKMVQERIKKANGDGRRTWFVVEHRYLRPFKPGELEQAYRNKRPDALTVRDIHFIMAVLDTVYGKPQRVLEAKSPQPLYDEMVAYLYGR
jgi:uncharacterized membrane protein